MSDTEAGEGGTPAPFIDFDNLPAPSEGFRVIYFITVRNVAASRAF